MEKKTTIKIKFEDIEAFQCDSGLPIKTLMVTGHLDWQAFLRAMNDQKIEIPKGYKFERTSRWYIRKTGTRLLESYPGQAGAFKATVGVFTLEQSGRGSLGPKAGIKK